MKGRKQFTETRLGKHCEECNSLLHKISAQIGQTPLALTWNDLERLAALASEYAEMASVYRENRLDIFSVSEVHQASIREVDILIIVRFEDLLNAVNIARP